MASIQDILRNPLRVRKEKYGTTDIFKLVIDGNTFSGYKTYSAFWEKTYVEEPSRSIGGSIDNLNSHPTFKTFHIIVNYSMMSIEDYRRLYGLILDRNEFIVSAYDVAHNKVHTCKMYFAPDQMPKIYSMTRQLNGDKFAEVLGIQDYTIELIGTNADMDIAEIRFYDENDNLIPNATKPVILGEEVEINQGYVASVGYRFEDRWQKEDGSIVNNGTIITPLSTDYDDLTNDYFIKLKAVVVPTNEYTLSLNYGVGTKPEVMYGDTNVDSFKITIGQTIGDAIRNANITLSDGEQFAFPENGTEPRSVVYGGVEYEGWRAYLRKGWYFSAEGTGTEVSKNYVFDKSSNVTLYQLYEKRSHTVTYNTNDESISIDQAEVPYGEKLILPSITKNGKTIHWTCLKYDGTEISLDGTMPPFNITLNGEWK